MSEFEKDLREFMKKYDENQHVQTFYASPESAKPDRSNEINLEELIRYTIKEAMDDAFCSEQEFHPINSIQDKLNELLRDEKRAQRAEDSIKILDKFEDYMKNIDKLNALVNEFKGCVSISRAAIAERNSTNGIIGEKIVLLVEEQAKINKELKKNYVTVNMILKHISNLDNILSKVMEEEKKEEC